MGAFTKMPSLTSVNLKGNKMGEEGTAALAKVLAETNIQTLNLASTTSLASITSRCLDLGGLSAVIKLAEVLSQTSITSLNLASNNITNGGEDMSAVIKLAEVLSQTSIPSLNLEDNYMGAEGAAALVKGLPGSKI